MGVSIGNKVELVLLDDIIRNVPNRKVYVSKLYDILPKNRLEIAMPIYEGKIVPFNVNESFSACFYTDKGLLQCKLMVVSRYKSGNLFFLEVKMLDELSKVQRRQFYRFDCNLEARIRIVSDEEYEMGAYENVEIPEDALPWNEARILDISGGGAKIISRGHIDKNEVIKIKFSVCIIDEIVNFNLFARILSSGPVNGKTGIYEQRLEFMKITQENRDTIIKFIFESERIIRAKQIGLV